MISANNRFCGRPGYVGLCLLLCALTIPAAAAPSDRPCYCRNVAACDGLLTRAKKKDKEGGQEKTVLRGIRVMYENTCRDPRLLVAMANLKFRLGRFTEAIEDIQEYHEAGIDDASMEKLAQATENDAKSELAKEQARRSQAEAGYPLATESNRIGSTPERTTSAPQARIPISKHWWLWTAVGIAGVGIAVGAALGAYASAPHWSGATEVRPFP